ncbi:MAG: VTT domain-containing protein [Clostridia bacterium]|nr:VTT domain-containing protein [Clostridia bacterium]
MAEKQTEGKNYGGLVKILQIASGVLMLAMVVLCVVMLKKYDINVKNVGQLTQYLSGGVFTIALIITGFSVIKSFALVFPPAVLFVLTGIVCRDAFPGQPVKSYLLAVLVNFIATAASLILPYFLGRFTGKPMVDSMKGRFKAVKKIDDFADANNFSVVFIFKAGGLMPSDLSSLIFGAMNIPFAKYYLAANLGMLILNCLWTIVGVFGDPADPLSYLYALPALVFAIAAAVYLGVRNKKKNAGAVPAETANNETQTEDVK